MKFQCKIPIRTYSEANLFEHWTKKHKRKKEQDRAVKLYLNGKVDESWLPCQITLTRIAPRTLDHADNLPMSFKTILDSVCNVLIPGKVKGQADSDSRIQVKYVQIKGISKEYAVEIEIESF